MVPILDELRRGGHEVHVMTLAAEVERLVAGGFAAQPIDERIEAIRHDDWQAKGARASLAASTAVFVARAPHDARDLRTAVDELDPDLLVVDINAWGAMAVAEGSGHPWAAVAPYLLPISSPDAPPYGPGLAPGRRPAWVVARCHCPATRYRRRRARDPAQFERGPGDDRSAPAGHPDCRRSLHAVAATPLPHRRALRVPPPLVAGQRPDGRPMCVGA
jgi:UDP:flavonoid glycosyltransferase YjiC (YdhE family)